MAITVTTLSDLFDGRYPAIPEGLVTLDVSSLLSAEMLDRGHQDGQCVVCGRRINGRPKFEVQCVAGGLHDYGKFSDADTFDRVDPGYIGVHAVGSECVKKVRKAITEVGQNPDDFIRSTT